MATAMTLSQTRSTGYYVRIVAATFVVVCLSSAPLVALTRWVVDEPPGLDTWPYAYTFWGAALVGTALFFVDVVAPMTTRPLARSEILLASIAAPVALALWALVSVAWTDAPGRTPMQGLLATLVVLTAVWFGYGLTFRQQVLSLFIGVHAVTIASAVLALSLRSARDFDDDWIGMFGSGDALGPVSTLGVVVALGALLLAEAWWLRIAIVVCAAADGLVAWQTGSATAWMSLAAAVIALAIVMLARGMDARRAMARSARIAITVLLTCIAVSMPWTFRLFVRLADDDSTLAARREIWDFVIEAVEDRWIVGFGFQSFWGDDAAVPGAGGLIDSAHSTFMEVLLQLGGIGLLLVLVVVALSFGRMWWEALGGQSLAMAWWVGIATFALLQNVNESSITYHSIFWVLLIAPAFAGLRAAASKGRGVPVSDNRQQLPPPSASYTYQ